MSSKHVDTDEVPYKSTKSEDILKEILEKIILQKYVTTTTPTTDKKVHLV